MVQTDLAEKEEEEKKTVVIANVFVLNEKLYWYIFHCRAHFGNCTSKFLRVAPFFQITQAHFLNCTSTLSHQHLFQDCTRTFCQAQQFL